MLWEHDVGGSNPPYPKDKEYLIMTATNEVKKKKVKKVDKPTQDKVNKGYNSFADDKKHWTNKWARGY
jgi:hypothetical protein